MHELSIVHSIIDIAEKQVKENQASQVDIIELEIGQLAGVEWSALDFAWEAATAHTVLEHAERQIIQREGRAKCMECLTEYASETLFTPCPTCGSYFCDFIQGKELRIKSLTIS
ncbi:MAG: hydrogenase maturation nickel metallochaperone HypA [Haliscomenobacter sp.]